MIGLLSLEELMLTKPMGHVSALFGTFSKINVRFQPNVYNFCHDLTQKL